MSCYVDMYVCVYIYIYIYIHTYTSCIFVYTRYIHTRMFVYGVMWHMFVYMRCLTVYLYLSLSLFIYIYIYIYIYICIMAFICKGAFLRRGLVDIGSCVFAAGCFFCRYGVVYVWSMSG